MKQLENAIKTLKQETDIAFSMGTRLAVFGVEDNEDFLRYKRNRKKYFLECCPVTRETKPSFMNEDVIMVTYVSPQTDASGKTTNEAAYIFSKDEIDEIISGFVSHTLVVDGVNVWNAFIKDFGQNWSSYPEEFTAIVPPKEEDIDAIVRKHLYDSEDEPIDIPDEELEYREQDEALFNSSIRKIEAYEQNPAKCKPTFEDLFIFFAYDRIDVAQNILVAAYQAAAEKLKIPVSALIKYSKDDIVEMFRQRL